MIFSSLVFLCVFFPVVFVVYWIVPSLKWQNVLLVMASILFYSYGEPRFVILMLVSVLLNYTSALVIHRWKKIRVFVLSCNIITNLGVLSYFKYSLMLVRTINGIIGENFALPTVMMPLGISFFTFQGISYVVDVYRGKNEPEVSVLKVLLYITFFPQLIAGPIVKYHEISAYLDKREKNIEKAAEGFRRFCFGLGKKVLIANTMAVAVDKIFEMKEVNIVLAWIGAIGYMMQIYYDFSGYSDMAIGMAKMFGMEFQENFNYPYAAGSIKDFWRRWHISLSSWFREYLYIPLGGNRKGKFRTVVNKMLVFFCTGLWHGGNWTFVMWGIYHGFFMMMEDCIKLPIKKIPRFIKHVYTLIVICVGFVVFRSNSLGQAAFMIRSMITKFYWTTELHAATLEILDLQFISMLIVGAVCAVPVKKCLICFVRKFRSEGAFGGGIAYISALIVLLLCMCNLAGNGYNPFIYYRF